MSVDFLRSRQDPPFFRLRQHAFEKVDAFAKVGDFQALGVDLLEQGVQAFAFQVEGITPLRPRRALVAGFIRAAYLCRPDDGGQ